MNKKRTGLILVVLAFSLFYVPGLFSTAYAQGKVIPMTVAHNEAPGTTEDKAMVRFAEIIEKLTEGEIKPKVHHSAQLGEEKEILEGMKMGTIHASNITTGVTSNWIPEMAICDLPYVFLSEKHVQHCLYGAIGDFLAGKAEKKGFTVVGYYFQDFRNISGKKAITALDDLKGLRLRTMQVPVHLKAYKALGANTTPMSMGEVYMGLKTGVIDACEPPLTFWWEKKYYEVANHFSFTQSFYCGNAVILNKKWFDGLTPKQQLAIRIAAQDSSVYYNKERDEDVAKYMKEAKAKGVQFHQVNMDPFVKACAPIRRELAEQIAGKEGLMLIDMIEKLAKMD